MSKIDDYYINNDYIKITYDKSVIYCYDTILEVIYPSNHYHSNGPWSKFINLYEFEYKKLGDNKIYFMRIIEPNPNRYNLENQPNLLYYLYSNNINENKWLYLNNKLEFLTDSKVIIRFNVNNKSNLDYLIKLILEQPLDELVFNDNSSNKLLLINYLMEQKLNIK